MELSFLFLCLLCLFLGLFLCSHRCELNDKHPVLCANHLEMQEKSGGFSLLTLGVNEIQLASLINMEISL